MKALITGASSGIGRDMALYLSDLGWELIVSGRNLDNLRDLADRVSTNCRIIQLDLSESGAPQRLYRLCKRERIDLLVNNAGFGAFGFLEQIPLEKELELIDVNVKAVHVLTKLFLRDFKGRNRGKILNVASSAAFMPGPLMASYYASKAYVLRLSLAVREELRRCGSSVSISVLCPGPVDTEFNNRAGVVFSFTPQDSTEVAKCAIDGTLRGASVIIPGLKMRFCAFGSRFVPNWLMSRIVYNIQEKKLR